MSDQPHSDLSRTYRAGAQEEPPDWVDRKILGMARQQGLAPVPKSRRTWVARWGFPMALAAVVVLSASVVLVMREEQVALERDEAPPPRSVAAPQAPPSQASPAQAARSLATPLAGARPSIPSESENNAILPGATSAPRQQAGALERSPPPRAEADELKRADLPRADVAPARQRDDSVGPAPAAPPPVAKVASVPPSSEGMESKLAKERLEHAPQAALPATGTPESAVLAERREAVRSRANEPASAAAPAAKAAASRVPAPVGDVAERAQETDLRLAESDSPERWLQRIAQLRKDGKTAEARASLDAFRKRYPAYPLPENLK